MDLKTFKRNYKYTCEKCGKFFRVRKEYCLNCGAKTLRKATKDDYRKVDELMMIEQKEFIQIRAKARAILDKTRKILQALAKNEAEYKELLKRKKAGESVEDLITKNRGHYEKLRKEDKEQSEIGLKWWKSEEGRYMFENMAMQERMNPIKARLIRNKYEIELRMGKLNNNIQKNEDEYENLLERKNQGDYVDDLIKQNRYAAESLKNSKKSCENAMSELRTEKKSDWRSKIVR